MDESRIDPHLPTNGRTSIQVARFGAFELRLDTGELHKYGANIRLQRRSFCVLQALIERHGEVVTRDELRARLWSDGTFVDYESGLNTAVNRLRTALGDSAETPVYVETLARLGYRFVAPVTFMPTPHANGHPPAHSAAVAIPEPERRASPRWWIPAAAGIAAVLTAGWFMGHASPRHTHSYRQLTVSPGYVQSARFLHDGKRVAYSFVSHGNMSRAFVAGADGKDAASPKPVNVNFEAEGIAGVSPGDEVALLSPAKNMDRMAVQLVQPDGSKAHELIQRAFSVDWAKDGRLARIFVEDGWFCLEFPVGRRLYRSRDLLNTARVSPHGDRVAFLEHPIMGDDAGRVMVVGPSEPAHALSSGWESVEGLAWHPSGNEVWFTAATSGVDRKLRAVNLRGQLRQVAEMPGGMVLHDISPSGDVLMVRQSLRMSMLSGSLRAKARRDISLLDWSSAVAITPDGKSILFYESGDGGGRSYSVYIYNADKDASERIASGRALDLSADGKWALTQMADDATTLSLISVKDHRSFPVKTDGAVYNWARFLAGRDCQEIVAGVSYPGERERLIQQELPNGKPVPVFNGLDLSEVVVDETGRLLAGLGSKPGLVIADLVSKQVTYLQPAKKVRPVAFADGGGVITVRREHSSFLLENLDPKTGALTPYGEMPASEAAGISVMVQMRLAHDRQTYVYSAAEKISTLYLVSGWT